MALINNLYIHIVNEEVNNDVESTSHPVEEGLDITSTIKRQPITISLSGSIVDYGEKKASDILSKLKELQKAGSLINYSGRNIASNMQIQSFSTGHPSTIAGGCSFSMELKEVRIAKKAYNPNYSSEQTAEGTPEIKEGSTVVFKGGSVYVSSDAKTAAASRGRSTCTVTKINTKSWATHSYHLISTDGGKVYGWVDGANIEGVTGYANVESQSTPKTSAPKTTSTQQPQNEITPIETPLKPISYTIKKGDACVGVMKQYEYLKPTTYSGSYFQYVLGINVQNVKEKAFVQRIDTKTDEKGKQYKVYSGVFQMGFNPDAAGTTIKMGWEK